MKGSYKHEQVSTTTTVTDQVINGCFLMQRTKKELSHLKAFQIDSESYSFIITYQPNLEIRHGNLDGHKIKTPLRRDPILKLEHSIPKKFLDSQETCLEHVIIILSEMYLPPSIQERLALFISTEFVNFRSRHRGGRGGGGFKAEANVKVNVELWVRIECCCSKEKDTCLVPARNVKAMDCCPICLTELSSAVSRMELQCTHVFHRDCVVTWLKKNPSCPICRTKALGETVSIY
ncbi:RING-H2 finger protein ATL70 [Cardamine amara subsp. amara]|uniref:RING-type E3 ubiquitin transferase n=1 Tax=Cardamine amara subsp. amara TaxID=228776 RepID=A0ABD1AI93_CARAN